MTSSLAGFRTLPMWLALALPAQETTRPARDAKAVVSDLEHIDPETVAWAAHDARILGDKSLIAPLQKTLARLRDDKDALVSFARLFVLDALAGYDAKVPSAELLPWLDDDRAGPVAFLLLARQSRIHEAELFELFRARWPLTPAENGRQNGTAQHPALRIQAIGNLLCEQKTPGFAAFLLEHTDLALRAQVVASGLSVEHSSSSSRVFFGPQPGLPQGLPPLPIYTYVRTDTPGNSVCELVAPGPIGIGIARRQPTTPPPPSRSGVPLGPAGLAQPEPWLWALAGDRQKPATSVRIVFENAEQYVAELGKARDELRSFRHRLVQDLVAKRALGEADAARFLQDDVAVQVDDKRRDKRVPLPELPAK